jgi:hypothetical protein
MPPIRAWNRPHDEHGTDLCRGQSRAIQRKGLTTVEELERALSEFKPEDHVIVSDIGISVWSQDHQYVGFIPVDGE